MSLQPEEIQKLCELARLEIDPAETDDLTSKLSDIVAFVAQLQATDTSSVEPMAHPLDQNQRLREDKVTETDQHELFQQNAASVERDLYLVPKVIE